MKHVIVTGGAGGLGIEIVKQHYAAGDFVWALDLKMNDAVGALLYGDRETHRLHFAECDIGVTQSVEEAAERIKKDFDAVDRIYSCAGMIRRADDVPLPETDLDAIAHVVDVNAVGFLRVMKAVLPLITAQTAIVCVTSEAASIANNHRSREYSYAMSKCAENMACVVLQKYMDESIPGARIVCLHPGWLKTSMGGGAIAEVDPADSARDLIGIAQEIHAIPRGQMFIDHLRRPMPW